MAKTLDSLCVHTSLSHDNSHDVYYVCQLGYKVLKDSKFDWFYHKREQNGHNDEPINIGHNFRKQNPSKLRDDFKNFVFLSEQNLKYFTESRKWILKL